MLSRSKILLLTSAAALASLTATQSAIAKGTAAGTEITNATSVAYQVANISQTAITATSKVTVDRVINFTVSEVGTATTSVTPGQTQSVAAFELDNTSNATVDFAAAVAQVTTGAIAAHGGTDAFDTTNVAVYYDSNNDGLLDVGDPLITYLDEVPADAKRRLLVVVDVPSSAQDGKVSGAVLSLTAKNGETVGALGTNIIATTTANTAGIDTVLADGTGTTDGARDGVYSAQDDFTVSSAQIALGSIITVVSNPTEGATNPKTIPGALLQYCITVTNNGSVEARNVLVTDVVDTKLTYDTAFGIYQYGTLDVSATTCNGDGAKVSTFNGGVVTGNIASLPAGQTRTIIYQATVN